MSSLPLSTVPSRSHRPSKQFPLLKTHNPFSVRGIVSQLSEAEVAGDIPLVRSLLSKLSNRSLLPAKLFIFHEDARPGYFGTWTRNSRIIGPRSPFAKDVLIFDYNYDSGEEWEQEIPGEADDVVDDGEDEDEDGDAADSDLDSWLVDDDDEPSIPFDDKDRPPVIPDLPIPSMKRKAEDSEKFLGKRRKVVIPLVPFAKGPCWESPIGHYEHSLFKPYQIQLFNGKLQIFYLTVLRVFMIQCTQTHRYQSTHSHLYQRVWKTVGLQKLHRTVVSSLFLLFQIDVMFTTMGQLIHLSHQPSRHQMLSLG